MNEHGLRRLLQGQSRYLRRTRLDTKSPIPKTDARHDDNGFTLVELLIVVTILPLIVGALSLGLISVFSLQTNVTNRITDTADAQVVSANYAKDVQASVYLTTDATSTPQCGAGTGTQFLGMESVLNQTTGDFQTVVSYVSVTEVSGTTTTDAIERLSCINGSKTPSSITTLAYDVPVFTTSPVTVVCESGASASTCSNTTQQWTQGYVPASEVATVTLNVTAPKTTYNYNLVASPAVSQSFNSGGTELPSAALCESTAASSGPYAGQLCLIDFSGLTTNDLKVAGTTGQCYNMSVSVQGPYLLHYCLGYSSNNANEGLVISNLPTDTDAGLGQSVYPGVPGTLALYMSPYIGTTTTFELNLSDIYVVNADTGLQATGWSLVSADAETTNTGETLTWSSDVPLTILNDDVSTYDGAASTPGNPAGNACEPTNTNADTVKCVGVGSAESGGKAVPFSGAAMVMATSSSTTPMTLTINTNNYEAFSFGMLIP